MAHAPNHTQWLHLAGSVNCDEPDSGVLDGIGTGLPRPGTPIHPGGG